MRTYNICIGIVFLIAGVANLCIHRDNSQIFLGIAITTAGIINIVFWGFLKKEK
ncbi:MAG: hypothetical protein M0R51_01625 [Clostridia bacterium]|jgi:hypothetical protein|nr:hypothetical protein [Clostridia bacterium]